MQKKYSKEKGNKNNLDRIKKELKDYMYYTRSNKQASDYAITTNYIIIYIKGEVCEGNGIAELLRKSEYVKTDNWYPRLEFICNNEAIQKQEDKEFKIKY